MQTANLPNLIANPRHEHDEDEGETQLITGLQLLTEAHEFAEQSAYLMGLELKPVVRDARESVVGETSANSSLGTSTYSELTRAQSWGELLRESVGNLLSKST